MGLIYLDNAATTPVDPKVSKLICSRLASAFANPSSLHAPGRSAQRELEAARSKVAAVMRARPEEITFTGSGTESDNLAVLGSARASAERGRHVIVSRIEHKAVLESAKQLEQEGFSVTYIPVDSFGRVSPEAVRKALRPDTVLVSVMYANNEIGTIQPIREIAAVIDAHRAAHPEMGSLPFLHTDACQAAGALSLDANELGVDLLSCSGSKIYGPKGIGCLYHRSSVRLAPIILGGGQERGLRSGTEQVALIAGFAEALCQADARRERESERLVALRDRCIESIVRQIPGAALNGHASERLPNNVSVSIPGIEGEAIVLMLDAAGIAASTGSACASHDLNPSHVLLALGLSPEYAHGSVRFSLGRHTTRADIDKTVRELAKIARRLRAISSLRLPAIPAVSAAAQAVHAS
jgi:cysteine desulfurase